MTLRIKLLVASILLTVVPLAVIGGLAIRYFSSDKEAFVSLLGSEVTPVVAEEVGAHVDHLVALLSVASGLAIAPGLAEADRAKAAAESLRGSGIMAARLAVDGRELAQVVNERALPKGQGRQLVLDALDGAKAAAPGGGTRIENVTRDPALPLARISLLRRDAGASISIVAVVPVAAIHTAVASSTFETWVVDADGRVLSHADPQVVAARTDASSMVAVRRIREGQTGSTSYDNLRGERVLGSYAPVSRHGLGVVQELPAEAVFGAVTALVRNLAIALLLVLVLGVVMAVLVARGMSDPLVQLAGVAREIGKGRFDVSVPPTPRGELGELAEALKSMQRGLADRDARLADAQEALVQSEKMSALGQLAAGITHEVKNPMAGIIGFAQLCLRQVEEYSPLVPHLKLIEKEGRRAKDILENLLRFARQEQVAVDVLLLNRVVEETARLLGHQLQISKVKLDLRLGEGLPAIMGNMNQLQQVLMNLMMNGAHAMQPKGGRLEVSTSVARNGMTLVEVKDEGHGIKEEHRGRLFTPFFTTKDKSKGTGLGLSVSYGIVQQHQGEIKVWSQEGVGTTFYVYLPPASAWRPQGAAA